MRGRHYSEHRAVGQLDGRGTRGVVLPLSLLHPMILLILPLLCSFLERKSMDSRLAFLKLFFSLWFSITRPNHFYHLLNTKMIFWLVFFSLPRIILAFGSSLITALLTIVRALCAYV